MVTFNRNLKLLTIQRKSINLVGQDYNQADYIFTNNISEVDKSMHKKYDIPNEFYKIYTSEIDDVIIYEMYKKKTL